MRKKPGWKGKQLIDRLKGVIYDIYNGKQHKNGNGDQIGVNFQLTFVKSLWINPGRLSDTHNPTSLKCRHTDSLLHACIDSVIFT